MSNGHVERVFSTLKLIKSDYRNCLSEEYLDDVVRIMVEGPPLSQWDSSGAIQLWWKDKQRRSVADVRKAPVTKNKKNRDESIDGYTPSSSVNLEDWDNLLADDDTDSHTDEESVE